ncbi:hypothetical protein SprV_1002812600 [Sparganum proliferum]
MACKRKRVEKECSQTVRQCRAKEEEEASLPRAKTASSLEVRRAKYARHSFMPASSVHWPWGHLASGGVNISTTFNLFLHIISPGDNDFPPKVCRCQPASCSSHGCGWLPKVRRGRPLSPVCSQLAELHRSQPGGAIIAAKNEDSAVAGQAGSSWFVLFSRRSGSLNHLCVGEEEEEEETSEEAKQEDFARKKGGVRTSVLSPVPADFIDFTRGKASTVTLSTENADQRLPSGFRQDCGCVPAASNGEGRPFAPAPFCHQKLLDTRGVPPLRSVSSNHENALFRGVGVK